MRKAKPHIVPYESTEMFSAKKEKMKQLQSSVKSSILGHKINS